MAESKTALIIIAEGTEEMEAIITADILRRGGIKVTIAGLDGADVVKCSRDVMVKPDAALEDVAAKPWDIIILPGGAKGAEALNASATVKKIVRDQLMHKKLLGAICAAPICLLHHDTTKGNSITSHPSVKEQLVKDYKYSEDRVVRDRHIITSRGPGTTIEFALLIVEALAGKAKAESLKAPMLIK